MNNSNNYYNKSLKSFARKHRNDSTKAEVKLWLEILSKKKMLGFQFLRQRPIDNFIADFFCKELKLIIETDGITHLDENVIKKDEIIDWLQNVGFEIIAIKGNYELSDYTNNSERLIVIAQKPALKS
jgi:very-short-patch-repair endonuclease